MALALLSGTGGLSSPAFDIGTGIARAGRGSSSNSRTTEIAAMMVRKVVAGSALGVGMTRNGPDGRAGSAFRRCSVRTTDRSWSLPARGRLSQ